VSAEKRIFVPVPAAHNVKPVGKAKESTMKILMVVTSHDKLGNTGKKTGFWLEEFCAPYFMFFDAGCLVTVASPKGGTPPLDPVSDTPEGQTDLTRRFKNDPKCQAVLSNTTKLSDVKAQDYDAIFYPGGHGPMWDLAEDPISNKLIETFYSTGKPVAAICHAPGVLRHATFNGEPIVKGKRVTGLPTPKKRPYTSQRLCRSSSRMNLGVWGVISRKSRTGRALSSSTAT
jgi:putative intracellular protease/amidase